MATRHYVGTSIDVKATITDKTNALVDPTIAMTVQDPSGNETQLDVNHNIDDDGIYTATIDLDEPGIWDAIIQTTGTHNATRVIRIEALPLPFDPND